jgi:hypothetical protein
MIVVPKAQVKQENPTLEEPTEIPSLSKVWI